MPWVSNSIVRLGLYRVISLFIVPIEEATGKVLGSPEAITTPSPYVSQVSFSRDGR